MPESPSEQRHDSIACFGIPLRGGEVSQEEALARAKTLAELAPDTFSLSPYDDLMMQEFMPGDREMADIDKWLKCEDGGMVAENVTQEDD